MIKILSLVLAILQVSPTPTLDKLLQELKTLMPPPVTVVVVDPPPIIIPPSSQLNPTTSAELQTALDTIPTDGSTTLIVVSGDLVGNWVLKNKPTKTIVKGIEFEGRAKPTYDYPTLRAASKFTPTIRTDASAGFYTFIGLEVTGVDKSTNVIQLGTGAETLVSQLPHDIVFDKVWIHGTDAPFGHRGIFVCANQVTVTNSYFDSFVEQGRDSNAIGIFTGQGFLINNNWFEASGEGIIVGGVDPKIPDHIPSDIVFTNNTFFKPPAWQPVYLSTTGVTSNTWSTGATLVSGYPGAVKNCAELKNARNVIFVNNVFENVWTDAQSGSCVLFTVRNQSGTAPWSNITDVLFKCNVIKNVPTAAFNILGFDNLQVSGVMDRITISSNYLINTKTGFMINNGKNITIDNNVITGVTNSFLNLYGSNVTALNFNNNYVVPGQYGIAGTATVPGLPSLVFAPGYIFLNNKIETSVQRPWLAYPPGNTINLPVGTTNASSLNCAA